MSLIEEYAKRIVELTKVCPTTAIAVPHLVFRAFVIEFREECDNLTGRPTRFNGAYESSVLGDEKLFIEGVEIRAEGTT